MPSNRATRCARCWGRSRARSTSSPPTSATSTTTGSSRPATTTSLPYFAGLVGLSLGPSLPASADAANPGADAIWRRAQVADAITDRSRKGSFSVLEQLAAQATGWPARAIEIRGRALATPSVRIPDIGHRPLTDLSDMQALEVLGTPLSDAAPLTDVRRLSSHRTRGTVDPSAVAVWLWRLVADRYRARPGGQRRRGEPLHVRPARPGPPARRDPGQRSRGTAGDGPRRRREDHPARAAAAARGLLRSRAQHLRVPRRQAGAPRRRSWSPTSTGGASEPRPDGSASIRSSAGSPSRCGIRPTRRSR